MERLNDRALALSKKLIHETTKEARVKLLPHLVPVTEGTVDSISFDGNHYILADNAPPSVAALFDYFQMVVIWTSLDESGEHAHAQIAAFLAGACVADSRSVGQLGITLSVAVDKLRKQTSYRASGGKATGRWNEKIASVARAEFDRLAVEATAKGKKGWREDAYRRVAEHIRREFGEEFKTSTIRKRLFRSKRR